MPFLKQPRADQPLWRQHDGKAQKSGILNTMYSVSGDQYTGDWQNNKRHGKGTQRWTNPRGIYDGDWQYGKRSGFGTHSEMNHAGAVIRQYSGAWKNDKRHGHGTQFYSENEFYEGEWGRDHRHGWGRMSYEDGTVYEGEWQNNQRSGEGVLILPNLSRYEGGWSNDQKNGPGKFIYVDRGQVYEGFWKDDLPRFGEMEDVGRSTAPNPTFYPIPELQLKDPRAVIEDAENQLNAVPVIAINQHILQDDEQFAFMGV